MSQPSPSDAIRHRRTTSPRPQSAGRNIIDKVCVNFELVKSTRDSSTSSRVIEEGVNRGGGAGGCMARAGKRYPQANPPRRCRCTTPARTSPSPSSARSPRGVGVAVAARVAGNGARRKDPEGAVERLALGLSLPPLFATRRSGSQPLVGPSRDDPLPQSSLSPSGSKTSPLRAAPPPVRPDRAPPKCVQCSAVRVRVSGSPSAPSAA